MSDTTEKAAEQAAAFQKIWAESMHKLMQTAFTFTPDSAPPEVLRQIRSGIFQALAESWQEYMRSPQFLEGMKQWMETAVAFRQTTNDFMAKVRNEMQAPSHEDIDSVMLSVRHLETRLLDRLEELAGQVRRLNEKLGAVKNERIIKPRAPASDSSRRNHKKRPSSGKKSKSL